MIDNIYHMSNYDIVREYYDNLSDIYDEFYGLEQMNKINFIREVYKKLFDGKKFEKGLDFGCGTGISTQFLSEISNEIYIYDISDKMINITKSKFPNAIAIKDFSNYKEYFDIILSVTVLQDSPNPEKELNLIKDILKPDGIFILSVLNKKGIAYWKNLIRKYFTIRWFEEEEKDFVFVLSKNF